MGSCSFKSTDQSKSSIKSSQAKGKNQNTGQQNPPSSNPKNHQKADTDRPQDIHHPNETNILKANVEENKRRSGKKKLTVLSTNDDTEIAKEFERELSFVRQASFGKKEQGSLLIVQKPVMFAGKISNKSQSEFEDKLMAIEGDDVKKEHLIMHGIWVSCKKGLKPESPNQDDFVVVIEDNSVLLGVFDGHGSHGHEISNFLHKVFPRTLMRSSYWPEYPNHALTETFPSVHNELVAFCNKNSELFDCTLSGSTATLVYIRDRKIYTGHVGDSRAILGKRVKGKIIAFELTRDHKPTLDDESERIKKMGGEIRRLDDDIPHRVFFKGKHYPGIAMSRTMGDQLAQSIGVVCTPEVKIYDIEDNDEFVLVCSDGVWEFISNQEAAEEVSKYTDPRTAAERLAALAWTKWIKNEEDVVDDITVVLRYFKNNV